MKLTKAQIEGLKFAHKKSFYGIGWNYFRWTYANAPNKSTIKSLIRLNLIRMEEEKGFSWVDGVACAKFFITDLGINALERVDE